MKWLEKIRTCRKDQILILLLSGILLLVIALPTGEGTQEDTRETQSGEAAVRTSGEDQAELLERKLENILGKVAGVGRAKVMITLRSDGQRIVEKDPQRQESREESHGEGAEAGSSSQLESSESTVYQKDAKGNEAPYVTETLAPEIAGVLVIAEGGGNAAAVNEITEAVMALFGVEAHKIKVMKME